MDVLLLVLVVIIFAVILVKFSGLNDELLRLRNDLIDIRRLLEKSPAPAQPEAPPKAATKLAEPTIETKTPEAPIIVDFPSAKPEPAKPKEIIIIDAPETIRQQQTPAQIPEPATPTQGWFTKWLHDNPDMEKFIGENLINKIGIAVLVLGIAFFVKYAIDQEWINEIGRVSIGLFCGSILIWLANRMRKSYHAFSSVLVGGGLSVFYFTIAFAFHQYHLISQTAAFILMVVITAFAVLLSVLYDRIELGILATIGGFITPFLVSTGDGNWLVLFSYLSILNAGLIILAYYKRWRIINFIAFFFTELIYLGWIVNKSGTPVFSNMGTFVFGGVFYFMFILMNVIHHVSRASKLKAFDFIILLSANLCIYGAGIFLLQEAKLEEFKGLFTASLGVINLILAYVFFKQTRADKKFIYLLIGITVSFISLAAPVQLKGHYITLFWATEIVLLLWLYQKSFISLFKVTVLLLTILMLISLLMDWSANYSDLQGVKPLLINKGWITGVFVAICTYCVYRLLKKEADTYFALKISNRFLRGMYSTMSVSLFYLACALEVVDQFVWRTPGSGLQFIYLPLLSTIFALVVINVQKKLMLERKMSLSLILASLVFLLYILSIRNTQQSEAFVLSTDTYKLFFAGSWLSAILLLWLAKESIFHIKENPARYNVSNPVWAWIISVACITIFSAEFRNLYVWVNFSNANSIAHSEILYNKAGLTIVWALSSFAMIWLGLKYSYKPLRIAALVVFAVSLTKLFVFDIQKITPGGKIIAFILLGVLLLIISFMYQRLKRIIIDDAKQGK